MARPSRTSQRLQFGDFELDLITRKLFRDGHSQTLAPQPFQVLELLTRDPGELVTREELVRHLWPADTFVDYEQGLKKAINRLRETLGDSAENPRYIETLPRLGYRFIAEVHREDSPPVAPPQPVQTVFVPEDSKPALNRKDPRLRYWTAFFLLAAICLAAYLMLHYPKAHSAPIQAVAVLPLDNLVSDPSQDGLTDGLSDEIITDLAKLGDVRVISRASSVRYRGTHRPVLEIARDLHVDALVQGSFERSGDKVRLRVQLIRCANDQTIWAESYDGSMSDLFRLESEVARDIALHVQQRNGRLPEPVRSGAHVTDPQAFQDYLKGRHYWALRTRESLQKAVEYFEAAIQRDPKDARSYAALAHCYLSMPFLTDVTPAQGFARARVEADHALALEPDLAEAHLAKATVLMYNDWNFPEAEREFRRALELNPNDATAHQWHGELLSLVAHHEEAIQEEKTAVDLDPLSAIVHHEMGGILRDAGHYDDALRLYQQTLTLDPQFDVTHWEMARLLRRQGKLPESIEAFRQGAQGVAKEYRIDPAMIREIDVLQSAYLKSGRSGYFRQSLKFDSYLRRPSYYWARDYAQLGEREAALAALQRSYQNRDPETLWVFVDPELEPVRDDPRYKDLVRAVGFSLTTESAH